MEVLAGGGPVWSCGYDDHSIPPVRGGGGQAGNIAGHHAVMALLVAQPVPDEIVVERARVQRLAEREGRFEQVFARINASAAQQVR